MVFLRLTVKVYPREQLSSSSSSSWGRTLLGARKSTNDDSSQGSGVSTTLKKPGVFLLVLEHPEEVSLGGLAGMIQEHWGKLHPELEPLAIKKILDDTKEDIDLYPDLTVADVWVDYGKARADGLDQRGSVRVIQKPSVAAPERFPSVDQDWDAAIVSYERKRAMKDKKEAMESQFPAIQEEDEEDSAKSQRTHSRSLSRTRIEWEHSPESPQNATNEPHVAAKKAPAEHRHRDMPVFSVEIRSPVTTSPPTRSIGPTIAGTPPPRRESEELGESPSPAERQVSSDGSNHTSASAACRSPKPQSKKQRLGRLPIPSSTATRTITQMPDDAESSPLSSEPQDVIPHQQMQTTEETVASSSDRESEPGPQRIAKTPHKPGITNGVNGQGHLAEVAKIVSQSTQKKRAETVAEISSGESSEDESDSDSDSEHDEAEAEKKKTAQQDQRETEDQTGSDNSDSDSDSDTDSDSVSDSESESDSDASEEDVPKDEPITPRIDPSIPNGQNGAVIDAEGDVQMDNSIVDTTHDTGSRKRKQASEEPTSVKEARQRQAHPSTRPPSTPPRSVPSQRPRQSESNSPATQMNPVRPRNRAPSFSSPARQASVREQNRTPPKTFQSGIGLGITQSPSSHQPFTVDLSQESNVASTQDSFGGPLFPSSNVTATDAPSFTPVNKHSSAIDRTKNLHSVLRGKDSPATERRSVSFAEGENLASSFDSAPRSTPRNSAINSKSAPTAKSKGTPSSATPRNAKSNPKSAQQTPTSGVKNTQTTPSTSTSSKSTPKTKVNNPMPKSISNQAPATQSDTVYPPGVDVGLITQQIEAEKRIKAQQSKVTEKLQREKETAEREEIERKLPESFDPQLTIILTEMHKILKTLSNTRIERLKRKPLRDKLEVLREDLKVCEQRLEAKRSTPRRAAVPKPKMTLKDMLSSQKEELAAKLRPEPKSAPAPRSDVYEVPPSSDESESDSSDDDGDILPNGQSEKLRKPRSQPLN